MDNKNGLLPVSCNNFAYYLTHGEQWFLEACLLQPYQIESIKKDTAMTIKELDDKLNSPGFQDTENGDLFYNFFIYQYPAEKEYDIRRQITEFKANLIRPTNYVDVLTLNLFDEFCQFLDQKKFLKNPSMLQYQLEKEKADPSKSKNTQDTLIRNAHSPEFVQYIHQRILDHISIRMITSAPMYSYMALAVCIHIFVLMSF